jgi:hypothetical protein
MLAPLSPGRVRARGEAERRPAPPKPDSPFATLAGFRHGGAKSGNAKIGAGRR